MRYSHSPEGIIKSKGAARVKHGDFKWLSKVSLLSSFTH